MGIERDVITEGQRGANDEHGEFGSASAETPSCGEPLRSRFRWHLLATVRTDAADEERLTTWSIEGPGPAYEWRAVGESQGWRYRGAEPVVPVGLWWVDVYSFDSDRDAQTWYDGMAVPVQQGLASAQELDVPEALRPHVHASVHRFTFDDDGDGEDAEALDGSGILVRVVNEQADVVYVFTRMEAQYATVDQLVDVATQAAVSTLATARRAQ